MKSFLSNVRTVILPAGRIRICFFFFRSIWSTAVYRAGPDHLSKGETGDAPKSGGGGGLQGADGSGGSSGGQVIGHEKEVLTCLFIFRSVWSTSVYRAGSDHLSKGGTGAAP